jgi:hypothetical protein
MSADKPEADVPEDIPAGADATQEPEPQFDPADYTADAVLEYLRDADPVEVARVAELERALAKPRKSVLAYTDATQPHADEDGYTRVIISS